MYKQVIVEMITFMLYGYSEDEMRQHVKNNIKLENTVQKMETILNTTITVLAIYW